MHVMIVRIWAVVRPPTLSSPITVVDLAVPDHIGNSAVVDDLAREHVAVHTMSRIVGKIERVSVVVIALSFLVRGIPHDAVR
jgi:hypothetical protein